MTVRLHHLELLGRIRSRDLSALRGRPVEIRVDRLSAVLYRDVADLALARTGVASAVWRDTEGREEPAAGGAGAAARLAGQAAWHVPRALLRERRRLRRLARQAGPPLPTRRPERVLYLRTDHVFDLRAGGSVTHVAGVVNALRRAGPEVTVLASDRLVGVPGDDRFHRLTPDYGPLRNARELAHLGYDHQLRGWLRSRWSELRPDLLYHRHAYCSAIGPSLRAELGVPLVLEYNGSFVWMGRHWDDALVLFPALVERAERVALGSADLVVTVSDALRDDAIARGARPDRVLVEPNAVEPDRYHPGADDGAIRARYGIPPSAVVVGFIGTFGPWHGAAVLARAAARLLRTAAPAGGAEGGAPPPEPWFLLVGDGAEMPRVRTIVEEAGIGGRVVLTGLVPQEEGPAYLAACDILATPQVPNPDGTPFFGSPTKLFEYMATGRAIVASDLDQLGRLIDHGRTGVLVPPADDEALADAIRDLSRDPERRARLGAAARAWVLAHHTWDHHVGRILAALERPPTAAEAVAASGRAR